MNVILGNDIVVWRTCLIIGVLIFVLTLLRALDKISAREPFLKGTVACVFAAMTVLWFPLGLGEASYLVAVLRALSNSIGVFVLAPLIRDYQEMLDPDVLGSLYLPYQVVSGIFFVVGPVLTFTIVLSYFSGAAQRLRLWALSGRNLYIFSDLTQRSLAIAGSIEKSDNGKLHDILFVFCNVSKEEKYEDINAEARNLGAVLLTTPMSQLLLKVKRNQISYFEISDNSDDNVENTIAMVEQQTRINRTAEKRESIWIYCYSTDAEAEMLIDAQDSQGLRVILMNEYRDAVYQMLYQYPVYDGICADPGEKAFPAGEQREVIHLMILGGGDTGINFLKAAAWYGKMMSWELKITLVDIKGDRIRKSIMMACPDLMTEDISIVQKDVFSSDLTDYLKACPDVSYCVCAMKDDEDNIRSGLFFRRFYYLHRPEHEPCIFVRIRSDRKYKAVWQMHVDAKPLSKVAEKLYYRLIPFGNVGNSFVDEDNTSVTEEFLGMGVHCHYYGLTDEMSRDQKAGLLKSALNDYYRLQSNRLSSIASGMHIKARLWELGYGIMQNDGLKTSEETHDERLRESIKNHREKLANLEHARWMVYQYVNGWRLACADKESAGSDEELVRKIGDTYARYLGQFKNQNYLMKLHPALVPSHEKAEKNLLLSVEEEMKKRSAYNPGYWESDLKLIDYMIQIVEGTWCAGVPDGIYVRGAVIRSGQFKIVRLTDLLTVYLDRYKGEMSASGTDADIQLLREKIRQCASGILNNRFDEFDQAEKTAAREALKAVH